MALYEYRAIIKRVKDGDTIVVDIDQGFRDWKHDQPIRLAHIDAPRHSTPAGERAALYLTALLPVGTHVILRTLQDRTEKYGRWLGEVYLETGECVNGLLVYEGHAVDYEGIGPAQLSP